MLFKLDIDNGPVEKGTVDHLLSDDNDDLDWIDEFVWEHHDGQLHHAEMVETYRG